METTLKYFRKTLLIGGLVLFSAIAGIIPNTFSGNLLIFVVVGYVFLIFVTVSLLNPIVLIYFIILSSATSSLVRNVGYINLGFTIMSASGLRWTFVVVANALIIVYYFKRRGISKDYYWYIFFILYAIVRWFFSDDIGGGIKDMVWYSMPLVIGVFSYYVFMTIDFRSFENVDRFLRYSIFIVILTFGLNFLTGGLVWTKNGPKGDVVARTIALFATTAMTVSLARWHYHPDRHQRKVAMILSFVTLLTVGFTLSRTATATALMMLIASRYRPSNMTKLISAGLITGTLIAVLFVTVPYFRDRTFKHGQLPKSPAEFFDTFDSSGRFNQMWPATIESAMKSPIFGNGIGTARLAVAAVLVNKDVDEYHPHNEYLQIWHDFGLIGVIPLIIFYIVTLMRLWKRWSKYDTEENPELSYWAMAAFLAVALVAFTAITANTFHYPFITTTAFIIVGASDALVKRLDPRESGLEIEEPVRRIES